MQFKSCKSGYINFRIFNFRFSKTFKIILTKPLSQMSIEWLYHVLINFSLYMYSNYILSFMNDFKTSFAKMRVSKRKKRKQIKADGERRITRVTRARLQSRATQLSITIISAFVGRNTAADSPHSPFKSILLRHAKTRFFDEVWTTSGLSGIISGVSHVKGYKPKALFFNKFIA